MIKYREFLNLKKSFEPDYQKENPAGFLSAFKVYMDTHFDYDRHPERYLSVAQDAYRYANKSVLYDKLAVPFDQNPDILHEELFKSKFAELAKQDDDLIVKGSVIEVDDSLQKSTNNQKDINKKFEELWIKTFKTF